VLEGGRGKSRPLTPDLPAPTSRLVPPATLSQAERAEWKKHVAHFHAMGVESSVDAGLVEGLVRMLCRARAADKVIASSGMTTISAKGNEVKRPEVSVSRDSWQAYERIAASFGLSPAARAKLGGSGSPRERAGDVPAALRDAKRR